MNRPSVCENTPSGLPRSLALGRRAHTDALMARVHRRTPTHTHKELPGRTDACISTFVCASRARIQPAEPEETCSANGRDGKYSQRKLLLLQNKKNIIGPFTHTQTHGDRSKITGRNSLLDISSYF